MKIGIQNRSRLEASGPSGDASLQEFQSLMGALSAWTNHQHDDDGNHTDITAETLELTAVREAALHIVSGWMDAGAGVAYSGAITPTELDADVNDYSPQGIAEAFLLRLSSSVPVAIGGIKDGGRLIPIAGRVLAVFNEGAVDLTLTHEEIASSENYRFRLPGFEDMILPPNNFALLYYDAESRRWAMLSSSSGTGGSAASEFNAGDSGANITIDWAKGTQQIINLTHNANITLAHGVEGQEYRLILTEGGGGNFTPDFVSPTVVFENDNLKPSAIAAGEVLQVALYYTLLNGGQYFAEYMTPELELGIDASDLSLVDDTTNDVSTSAHGFAPKAPGDANTFLNGLAGLWTTPIRTLLSQDGSVPGGNTVANTVAETAFASTFTIPGDDLAVGDVLRLTLRGVFGTDVVAPTLQVKGYAGAVALFDTTAITLVAAQTNEGWMTQIDVIVTSIGVTGTLEVQGQITLTTAPLVAVVTPVKATAAVTVDTTTNEALTVTVTWGTANAANTVTLRQWVLERLRA